MVRLMRPGILAVAAALLGALPARAADQEAINAAIDKGVRHLRQIQGTNGAWSHEQIGMTALAGLTLLECDVPPDDRAIQAAAAAVRNAAVTIDQTYSIALSIMFLDRLGEPVDVALIESLTVRLLAGQLAHGAWTYACPRPDPQEERRLKTLVDERAERGPAKKASRTEPGQRTAKDLPAEIQGQLENIQRRRAAGGAANEAYGTGDNSNTQFAILGLWAVRNYGLPVDGALGLTEKYFRDSVRADGGWAYVSTLPHSPNTPMAGLGRVGPGGGRGSTPAMTCAGLLGLGLAYGAWNEAALRTKESKENAKPGVPPKALDPSKDRVVVNAFRLLGMWVDGMNYPKGQPPQIGRPNGRFYYFVWSLERVCVSYGLEKIGKTDWYDWGAGILVANQGREGGWENGEFPGGPDTCFALLVLKRADLVKGLNRALASRMKDGLQSTLRQGGTGGGDLVKGGDRKPFFGGEDPGERTGDDPARLADKLASAGAARQDEILKELRDGKGAAYTQALASTIPKLEGEVLKKAREALADRMARMTSETLGVKLDDDDAEVRRAAALAVAMREDRVHVPKLIELLNDREPAVARAAHAALKNLSNDRDFGPAKDANRDDRLKAMAAWRDWWRKQSQEK
jgi:hypothetical protein